MTTSQVVLAAAVVLAVVLLVRWVATAPDRRPDQSMTQFTRALDALRPDDAERSQHHRGAGADRATDGHGGHGAVDDEDPRERVRATADGP